MSNAPSARASQLQISRTRWSNRGIRANRRMPLVDNAFDVATRVHLFRRAHRRKFRSRIFLTHFREPNEDGTGWMREESAARIPHRRQSATTASWRRGCSVLIDPANSSNGVGFGNASSDAKAGALLKGAGIGKDAWRQHFPRRPCAGTCSSDARRAHGQRY